MAIRLKDSNYRIRKIDSRNYTFEKFFPKNKQGWLQVGGFYNDLPATCKALKDYIVQENIDEVDNVYELISLLTDIQIKYETIQIIGE